jgi:hypothetical protein
VIPERLYGREREIETLLAAFDRVVSSGRPELVLVTGYSGIGKSAVVNELRRQVTAFGLKKALRGPPEKGEDGKVYHARSGKTMSLSGAGLRNRPPRATQAQHFDRISNLPTPGQWDGDKNDPGAAIPVKCRSRNSPKNQMRSEHRIGLLTRLTASIVIDETAMKSIGS